MGLDIHLYEREAHEQNEKREREAEELWAKRETGELTEEQYDEQRRALTQYVSPVDVASVTNPDHLFNRRYLRSSYNDGGFNRAVPDLVGEDHGLYWIFEPMGRDWDGDEGLIAEADLPLLAECAERAEQVAEDGGWWSSLNFDWFGGDLNVVATVWGGASLGGGPALHVIYEGSEDSRNFYAEAALITAEFCREAISLVERDGSALMSWSG